MMTRTDLLKKINTTLQSLGWEKTDKKDPITGLPIYEIAREDGFNTGTYYTISVMPTSMGKSVNVVIWEEDFGSYSTGKRENQYFLDNLDELETLMRFKRIKRR